MELLAEDEPRGKPPFLASPGGRMRTHSGCCARIALRSEAVAGEALDADNMPQDRAESTNIPPFSPQIRLGAQDPPSWPLWAGE